MTRDNASLAARGRARSARARGSAGRLLIYLVVCGAVGLGPIGCTDLEWDWETGKWYPKEPVTTSKRRRVAPASTRPARRPPGAVASKPPAGPDDRSGAAFKTPRPAGPEDASAGGFYRLYLVSGPESVLAPAEFARENTEIVQVTRASASQVGGLLAELYPPVGPGGTEHRYYLVYQSPLSMRAAAQLAVQLDLGIEGIATGADLEPLEAFRTAIPLYYELTRRGSVLKPVDEVIARLELAGGSEQVGERLRWVTAMMIARIQEDYRADPEVQVQALGRARQVVPEDSFEAFLAGVALLRCYDYNEMSDQAEDLAKELVVRYQSFRATGPYQRCMRVATRSGR